jgi:hypothetical protein
VFDMAAQGSWSSLEHLPRTVEEVEARVLDLVTAGYELAALAVGDRLGWYAALAQAAAPMTARELAAATGTHPRYTQEWLEQQAATGLLDVQGPESAPERRRFTLPPAVAEVLAPGDAVVQLVPFVRQAAAALCDLPDVVEAMRTGGGVSWAQHAPDLLVAHGDTHRNPFRVLMPQWLATMPDVVARLERPAARVADVGRGVAWSSAAIARAFPRAVVDSLDLEPGNAERTRGVAESEGVGDRVSARTVDIASLAQEPAPQEAGYDLVTAFECVHDLADPVAFLAALRRMAGPDGAVLVMEEHVADTFTAPAGPAERLMYGFSLAMCLPAGMSEPESAATGTVMRQDVLERCARDAGFSGVEVLPVDHHLWRFFRLLP